MSTLSCPSRAWDRYCAMNEGPYAVGEPFQTVSTKRQHCASCYGLIEPGQAHEAREMHDDQGHFCGRERCHLAGQCAPDPKDWWEDAA